MSGKDVYTEIGGQRLKLTNLEKMLFPEVVIAKAEFISYLIEVAPYILKYISNRPLTLIRYPDGIGQKQFYTKNKPSWTPDWIPSAQLAWDSENQYLLANEPAHLAWIANLAALEIHIMNSNLHHINAPDMFIVDLDPPEHWSFEDVKEIAGKMRLFLMDKGYNVLAKLSGGKGIHLIVPIRAEHQYELVVEHSKLLMKEFIKQHPDCTLYVHKDKRKDKILLDIYRNHPGNTTIAPYSLRGKSGAPVSMPLPWSGIVASKSAQDYKLRDVTAYLKLHGDPWEGMESLRTNLIPSNIKNKPKQKVPQILESYDEKRDFEKTPEPAAFIDHAVNGKFVVQLHQASTLHYDLRLGAEGVLYSWAIPKGLPLIKDQARLAIQTENHAAEYIDFEGTIPKGQYGAGEMWLFDSGRFSWINRTESKYSFELHGKHLTGKFTLFKTKDDQWMIKRKEDAEFSWWHSGIAPMLSGVSAHLPKDQNKYLYEIKWDGIRVILYKNENEVKILSRSGRDISDRFTEFLTGDFIKCKHAIIDAELVCLDNRGRPIFADIISRMHQASQTGIARAAKQKPAFLYVFDCLYLDGRDLMKMTFTKRRSILSAILKTGNLVRLSETLDDGVQLMKAAEIQELEGIMAKLKEGLYFPGQRTDQWKKIKFRKSMDCLIIGYTTGKGDRSALFGALHLALVEDGNLRYMGKVGSGFDHEKMGLILLDLKSVQKTDKPIEDHIEEASSSTWIEPTYSCEIIYASLTNHGTLREPVFVKWWKDSEL